jgi:tetratricopeptide (TPR) repeat protein
MRRTLLILFALASAACFAVPQNNEGGRLPLTTHSSRARVSFERGMTDLENLRVEAAVADWREATKADPKCALAHLFVAYGTKDPVEERMSLSRARKLLPTVSEGERLMIRWLSNAREGDYVGAIANMNDVLAMYPKDPRLLFLTGRWLLQQEQFAGGIKLLERALAGDAEYPAALNTLGYAYAYQGQFDKAFSIMERYAAAAPKEPNPHDSYGEVLRMAGEFDRALLQYRAALKVDPHFYWSQFGTAETFALMGNEQRAREEYERATSLAPSNAERLEFQMQMALTYVREGKFDDATAALQQLAEKAHESEVERLEAEAHRIMATYSPDYNDAMRHLQAAESILSSAHTIAKADLEDELAAVLRVRAERASAANELTIAQKAVVQLQSMAGASRSRVVQRSYHAADGAVLMAQNRFAEAIPHLEEDLKNCMTARMLLTAYEKTGATNDAESLRHRLAMTNETSIEQALVVPRLRRQLAELAAAH